MKVAIAQIFRNPNALEENMQAHVRASTQAGEQAADVILFPELSLTGYNLKDAKSQAFTLDDSRLRPLQTIADKYEMTIIAGAPVQYGERILLASLIICPNQEVSCYAKQHLHGDEQKYFESASDLNPTLTIGNEKVAFAICADINYPAHSEKAKQRGATAYLASIYFENYEMDKAHRLLATHASNNNLKVVMANFAGENEGHIAGGTSGWWDEEGKLMQALSPNKPDLIIVDV